MRSALVAVQAVLATATGLLPLGCASTPKHAASGIFLGDKVEDRLDSAAAAYYLSNYLEGRRRQPELDARIDRLHEAAPSDRLPNREELAVVARDFSTDFAALFFADRVARNEANVDLHTRFRHYLDHPSSGDQALADCYRRYLVLFAPGWDYNANGHVTGADLARPRQLVSALGLQNRLIEFDAHGSVEANAAFIEQAIAQAQATGKRILIVGPSSAGPAIHLALSDLAVRGAPTPVAWVNLGGILQGSPLVDYYQKPPRSFFLNTFLWLKGWKKESIVSMSATNSRPRFRRLKLPDDMLVINYVGLSLSGSLSKFSKDKYPILQREGPNDGLTPLADIIAPHSLTLVAPGSDHFFAEDPRIDGKTVALTKCVISLLEKRHKETPRERRAAADY